MDNRIGAVYSVFSILAFIVLCAWSVLSFAATKAGGTLQATNRFDALTQGIAAIYARGNGFASAPFQSFVRSVFLQDPSMEALVIRSSQGEVEYVFARHSADVVGASAAKDAWTGRIRYNSSVQQLFTAQIPLPPSDPPLYARAVMTVVDRAAIYSIVRRLLIALIGFVILTAIVIVLAPLFSRGDRRRSAGRPDELGRQAGPAETSPEGAAEPADRPSVAPPSTPAPGAARKGAPSAELAAASADGAERSTAGAPAEALAQPQPGVLAAGGNSGAPELVPYEDERSLDLGPEAEDRVSVDSAASPLPRQPLPASVVLPALDEVPGEPPPEKLLAEIPIGGDAEPLTPTFHTAAERPDGDDGSIGGKRSIAEAEASVEAVAELEEALDSVGTPGGAEPRIETVRADIPDFEVTEIDRRDGSEEEASRQKIRPAAEELDDLAEIEDLEEIDGHRSADAIRSVHEVEALVPPAARRSAPPIEEPEEIESLEEVVPEQEPEPSAPPTVSVSPQADSAQPSETIRPTEGGEAAGLFNPETGLAWQSHLEQRLTFELERAASFDQDLVLGIIRCREIADDRHAKRSFAAQILAFFPFRDLCFEHGSGEFGVIIPNTDIDQGIRTMESFQKKVADAAPSTPRFSVGLTARNGRLLSGSRMIREAESAAGRAESDRRNTIFALRVDPGKYREYIKSTLK